MTLFACRCSGTPADACAEPHECPLLRPRIRKPSARAEPLLSCCWKDVLTSVPAGSTTAGSALPPPITTAAVLLGTFLSKNARILSSPSSSTASMIPCLRSSLCDVRDLTPLQTNVHALQPGAVPYFEMSDLRTGVAHCPCKQLFVCVVVPIQVLHHPPDCPACLCFFVLKLPRQASQFVPTITTPPRIFWKSSRTVSNFATCRGQPHDSSDPHMSE